MDIIDPVEMGLRIKNQRILLGLTQDQLSEMADITPRYCYDIEQGLKNVSLNTLCKLSKSLNLSLDYVVHGKTDTSEDLETIVSLCSTCPETKQTYLKDLISVYLKAVKDTDTITS